MSRESFADALRAELEAVVARYEALVRAHEQTIAVVREREGDALRAEIASLRAESERLRLVEAERKEEVAALRAKVDELSRELTRANDEAARERNAAAQAAAKAEAELTEAKARAVDLETETRAAREAAQAFEGTFAAERKFVEASRGLEGSLLLDALQSATGRDLDATATTYAALKERGVSVVLTQALKDRGRSAVHAPLLAREQSALSALALAAGCELFAPEPGTRFSAASMEKASTASDPAEEGNVVQCLVPGARLAGTEGALVFPRVVVATG